jgi:hypothetical protein
VKKEKNTHVKVNFPQKPKEMERMRKKSGAGASS